jgi:hypothetical protein
VLPRGEHEIAVHDALGPDPYQQFFAITHSSEVYGRPMIFRPVGR